MQTGDLVETAVVNDASIVICSDFPAVHFRNEQLPGGTNRSVENPFSALETNLHDFYWIAEALGIETPYTLHSYKYHM